MEIIPYFLSVLRIIYCYDLIYSDITKKIFVPYETGSFPYMCKTYIIYYIIETFIIILCTKVVKYMKSFIYHLIAIYYI